MAHLSIPLLSIWSMWTRTIHIWLQWASCSTGGWHWQRWHVIRSAARKEARHEKERKNELKFKKKLKRMRRRKYWNILGTNKWCIKYYLGLLYCSKNWNKNKIVFAIFNVHTYSRYGFDSNIEIITKLVPHFLRGKCMRKR